MKYVQYSLGLVVALTLCASAQADLNLQHLRTINLDPTSNSANTSYIGNNPSAVAWNGANAWVGGYTSLAGSTAIVKVNDVYGATPSFGTAFGNFSTSGNRGLTALAIRGNNLAASIDNGSGNANSVRLFDATAETLTWNIGTGANDSTRRGMSVAFDPGFNGTGSTVGSVATLNLGSGRRAALNVTTGAYLFSFTNGMIINLAPASTTWRGLAFDPDTGDLYTRESNRVTKAVRSGDNSVSGASTVIVANTTASAVDNQNLSFVRVSSTEKYLIFNDRSSSSGGQSFTTVIKASDTTGAAVAINWGSFTAPNGNGAYSFAFDQTTQTLAISDFSNRRLYIFKVGLPATISGTAQFQGLVAGASSRTLTIDFRPSDTNLPTITRTVTLTPDASGIGTYSISDVPRGTYVLHIKGSNTLSANTNSVDATSGTATPSAVILLGGDANGDNVVSLEDFNILADTFGLTTTDTGYDLRADFNGDGAISLEDFNLLADNFGNTGDQ